MRGLKTIVFHTGFHLPAAEMVGYGGLPVTIDTYWVGRDWADRRNTLNRVHLGVDNKRVET